MHMRLNEVLASEARAGRHCVLFIDEAHNLDESVLETVRLISNFETPHAKLLQIILAGHPSLADKLESPALRQRVSIRTHLKPLVAEEVECYIDHRLRVAGYPRDTSPFTPEAQDLLAARSEGIPRNVNNLCFHALISGFALSRKTIDIEIIREVLADLEQNLPDFEKPEPDSPGSPSVPVTPDERKFVQEPAAAGTDLSSRRPESARAQFSRCPAGIELQAQARGEPVTHRDPPSAQKPEASIESPSHPRVPCGAGLGTTSLHAARARASSL